MNREQYLHLRNLNELGQICYNFYCEKAKQNDLEIYDINYFMRAFNMWTAIDSSAIDVATSYYDSKFTIQTIILNNKSISFS